MLLIPGTVFLKMLTRNHLECLSALTAESLKWGLGFRIFTSSTRHPVCTVQFSSVAQSCRLFATPWIAARQAFPLHHLSLLKLMSIESVMPSSHLILCRPLLLLPPIPPSIRAFSNESTLCMRWPKYWSFSFSIISPSNEHLGLI